MKKTIYEGASLEEGAKAMLSHMKSLEKSSGSVSQSAQSSQIKKSPNAEKEIISKRD